MKSLLTIAFLLVASVAFAQTPPSAVFTASSDHSAVVGTTPVLTNYSLEVVVGTTTGALAFTKNLGKPTPVNGIITAPVPEFLGRTNGVYFAQVSAIGPGGTSKSLFSDPFSWISAAPAAAGKPSIQE